ncbi:replication restart helicase PriA [Planctomicrobium piriforme]|uniref:Replication restart protein PriA n=1 Tax=Planctomicrobium piriforme TaxID=1576369 RepID=A0A1I3RNC4_9PLAN|nr:primosomal protein N' [Planctomicrobium piriforme]SFJ46706.1 replication restart DNA helicase PriA [Planctomicrobium piriforme]
MPPGRQPALFELEPEPDRWELAAETDCLAAMVVFNRPLDSVYSYLVPDDLREIIAPGQRVRVPFGRGDQLTLGYCVGVTTTVPTHRKLKTLHEILDREPLLSGAMLDLTKWIGERYLSSWGQVLDSVIPAGVKKQAGTRQIVTFELPPDLDLAQLKIPAKQRAVLEVLQQSSAPLTVDVLAERAGCGSSPIDSLRRKGLIVPRRGRSEVAQADVIEVEKQSDLQLNAEQQTALISILEALREQRHETLLLHGVTGSGKTEVYIQAIREVVSYGRQAIVLVPEISLTPQTIRRFRARFPSVAVLHSHLSDADRHWHWQQIAEGKVQVVVGARSAIFAPVPQLGLIVIDEEHEATFKQNSTPRYHARDVARERARRENVPLVLGSATPTLESLQRARLGLDRLLTLKQRVERRPLPHVTLVDTRNDPLISKGQAIGRALGQGIAHALRERGQVILFLNLRGFSPVLWCPRCSGIRCPDCDVTLTWHKDKGLLLCHSCEYSIAPPERCEKCGLPGLRFLGTGTQRLEAEVRTKFPTARLLRMDSDSMRAPGSHDEALESFREGRVDLLLGTQMIAKGLDFPNVTLVGVIDADTLLHQPELRSAERTFQLISQVAGRTGRGDREGRVLVQTMSPMEPVIQFAARHDYDSFAERELEHRAATHSPPFSLMARLILRSLTESSVQAESRRIAGILRQTTAEKNLGVRILGPAPALITKLRKYYRYHLQFTAENHAAIQELWRDAAPRFQLHPDVEMTIDMDPLDLR